MRIKTIEKSLPLGKVYNLLLKVLKPKNLRNFNSYHTESHILIVFQNTKKVVFIIRISKNSKFNRTYLSIQALNSKYSDNDKLKKNNPSSTLASNLFQFFKNQNKLSLDYHLTKIPMKKLKVENTLKFKNIETRIINKLLGLLSKRFNYFNNLLKFPFSITRIDGSWLSWQRLYNPFINLIETRINELQNNNIQTFRNYDFAIDKDNYPRIFDLITIERIKIDQTFIEEDHPSIKKEREITLFNQNEINNDSLFNLRITFLYCNKKIKPVKLMKLLKLMNEVKDYSKKLKQRIKKCNKIEPQIIIISFFGYESKTLEYLRKHLYHETNYIIPIFALPPNKKVIWHNLRKFNDLSHTNKETKAQLKKLIKIGHKPYTSFNFKSSNVISAKDQYEELKEAEKVAKGDYELMQTWSKILNVNSL